MRTALNQTRYLCPVCGYSLDKPPADFTICPSCGVEFGYSDSGATYRELRLDWIQFGAAWSSRVIRKPIYWNAWSQLIKAGFGSDIAFVPRATVVEERNFPPLRVRWTPEIGFEGAVSATCV